MPDSKRNAAAEAPNGAQVRALVNGPELVLMWGPDGRSIYVEREEVAGREADGFSTQRVDPATLAGELNTHFDTAKRAIAAYWKGIQQDGAVDPGDEAQYAAAETAMRILTEAWGVFRQQTLLQYPVVEADAPEVVVDGVTVRYDPSQVPMRHELDGVRAFPAAEVAQRRTYGWKEIKGSD